MIYAEKFPTIRTSKGKRFFLVTIGTLQLTDIINKRY